MPMIIAQYSFLDTDQYIHLNDLTFNEILLCRDFTCSPEDQTFVLEGTKSSYVTRFTYNLLLNCALPFNVTAYVLNKYSDKVVPNSIAAVNESSPKFYQSLNHTFYMQFLPNVPYALRFRIEGTGDVYCYEAQTAIEAINKTAFQE
jgi:hypothetical protein